MKNISFIILIAFSLMACNKYEDYYSDINKSPKLVFYKAGKLYFDSLSNDSIKVNTTFILDYKIEDEESLPLQFELSDSNKDSVYLDNKKLYIKGLKSGKLTIKAKVTDSYNKTISKEINFNVFSNLKPVAQLKLNQIGVLMKYETEFNASDSYDQDQSQGGKISMYEYTIDNLVIPTDEPVIKFIFNSSGLKEVKLRVQDNEGLWSDYVKSEIIIK